MPKALSASTKVVANFDKTVREITKKVKKLFADVTQFMEGFPSSYDKNTAVANKVITSHGSTLQTENKPCPNFA